MGFRSGLIVGLFIIGVLGTTAFAADEGGPMQVKVSFDDKSVPSLLGYEGFEVVHIAADYCYVLVSPDGYRRMIASGYKTEVIHDDVSAFYLSRLVSEPPLPYGGYKTLSEMYVYLDDMISAHSGIMTDRISIGTTIEGRDIYAIKISDNPDIDEDEPELFFNSLIHSGEVITAEVLLFFMDHLTDNYGTDPEATDIVDNRELWFVVVMNPDGYYYNEVAHPKGGGTWRKNRRDNLDGTIGVDLNRNFDYMWGYDDLGSSASTNDYNYRGAGPFSEPESQAVRDFVNSHSFVFATNFHSAANVFIKPWGYEVYPTSDETLFRILIDSMATYNGYELIPATGNGCHEDWLYGDTSLRSKILSICVEVGGWEDDEGLWPEPEKIPELVSENLGVNLLLCRVADSVYHLEPPKVPELHAPAGPQGPDYAVSWSHPDTINTAVVCELVEYENRVRTVDLCETYDNWIHTDYWNNFFLSSDDFYSEPTSFYANFIHGVNLLSIDPIYVAEQEELRFQTNFDLSEGNYYFYVEVSTDGIAFEAIEGNITTNDDPYGFNKGNGITGLSGGWVEGVFNLSAYAGETIWMRFLCRRDNPEALSGNTLYIDDIFFIQSFETETVVASDLTEVFYSFTDKPDGVYYYRVRARDAQDQWGPLSNFGMVTVGSGGCCQVMGDYNHDGQFDILDIDDFIDWLLRETTSGQPAVCAEEADVSSVDEGVPDGSTDILDIDYMIGYLLRDAYSTLPDCP